MILLPSGLAIPKFIAGNSFGSHSYWRVNVTTVQGGAFLNITEVEFRATIGGSTQTTGGTATASSENGSHLAGAAFDTILNTFWQTSSGTTGWLRYQFASPVSVAQVAILAWGSGAVANNSPKNFTIDYSDNGSSWTTAYTSSTQAAWANGEVRTFNL